MSDQGERGVRWTEMSESGEGDPRDESPVAFPEPEAPEMRAPAPADPAEDDGHDVWGKVEQPVERPAEPAGDDFWGVSSSEPVAEAEPETASQVEVEADDVKVAPVDEDDSLFGEGAGDPRYVPAVPVGSTEPAKPGKPSSGNWQMPEWMADEATADAKLGAAPASRSEDFEEGGRSRLVLLGGVGLLAVAVLAAGGVFFVMGGDDEPEKPSGRPASTAAEPKEQQVQAPPDKQLPRFSGRPSRVVGRVADAHSGLSYPRLASPWLLPTKKNKLGVSGWSGQQILVTEKRAGLIWYGQLLTGTLVPTLQSAYEGPDSVKNVAALAAGGFEQQYYAFPHRKTPLGSQALTVDGRKGWLIASYLTYKRAGVRATGEIVLTAVIDTGRPTPAVVFASMPNTHRKMWPDLNQFVTQLKIAG